MRGEGRGRGGGIKLSVMVHANRLSLKAGGRRRGGGGGGGKGAAPVTPYVVQPVQTAKATHVVSWLYTLINGGRFFIQKRYAIFVGGLVHVDYHLNVTSVLEETVD